MGALVIEEDPIAKGNQAEAHIDNKYHGTELNNGADSQPPLSYSRKQTPNLAIQHHAQDANLTHLTINKMVNGIAPRPYVVQRSASNDSYRIGSSHGSHVTNLRHKPSEAARLRVMSNGSFQSLTDVRSKHEASPIEDSSRSQRPASK